MLTKSAIQTLLKQLGCYHRVRSSCLYDLFWRIADSRLLAQRQQELNFYRDTLHAFRKGFLVYDVGANVGHKTDIFLRLGARVVAIDPDPLNATILSERFLQFRLQKKSVSIIAKAVSDHVGVETMWIDAPGSAKNTLNRKWVDILRTDSIRFGQQLEFGERKEVETTTLDDIIRDYGLPFYVKIDVEGHEPTVLRSLHRIVPYVSFEANLPEFLPEARECIDILEASAPGGSWNYTSDCTKGLALKAWLPRLIFDDRVANCQEESIEIFWKSPVYCGSCYQPERGIDFHRRGCAE